MSPDNPTQILTTHDLSNLRSVQRVLTTSAVEDNSNNPHSNQHHSNNNSSSHNNSNSGNLVFSTIPLDGHALLIQHSLSSAEVTIAGNLHQQQQQQSQQQQRSSVTTTNGLRLTAINSHNNNNNNLNNSNNSLNSLLAKAGLTAAGKSNKIGSNLNGNMPGTSKYVLLQQNGNGQFTTYEGTTATPNSGNGSGAGAPSVGNIVLLATEPMPMELNGSVTVGGEPARIITASGDNDEELRSLAWLNDSNLIKGIVTTTTAAGSAAATNTTNSAVTANGSSSSVNLKRNLSSNNGNICIVNATSNGHELIEELPTHVANEEHVTTAASTNSGSSLNGNAQAELHTTGQKITALSVSEFQQQFKRFGSIIAAATPITLLPQDATAVGLRKDEQHIFSNIAALGGTTTVHVGPSGTTTVVEYKSNANYLPAQRQLLGGGNSAAAINAANTTATNLSNNSNNNNNSNTNSNYVPSSTTSSSAATASSHNQIPASVNASSPTSTPAALTVSPAAPVTVTSAANCSPSVSSAVLNIPKQLTLPGGIVSAVNGNSVTVVNSNNTTNTIYQGQQKPQSGNSNSNNNNNNNISSSSSSSTTHHPHKKYLREKMNVLDHGGGGGGVGTGGGGGGTAGSTTIVASPASSNNSLSSAASNASSATSSSTAAVNGGNSPISKTFYGGSNNNNNNGTTTSVAINYSNSANSSTLAFVGNAHQSGRVLPESINPKDYYTLITQQEVDHMSRLMRSPTSYSSYDNDSLKDFEVSNASSTATVGRHNTSTPQQQQPLTPKGGSGQTGAALTPQKQKHPNNVPYDPYVHSNTKPPYSFSSLIFMAIESSNEKALPVKEIYAWIMQHFPYFKSAPTGWKNSVRHNLSLNKSFVKVEKAPNMGKGSLWRVEPQQRPNLIQALSRSPFFPNSAVDKIVVKSPVGGVGNVDSASGYDTIDSGGNSPGVKSGLTHINSRFDPRLYPNLSKAFKVNSEHGILSDVADDETPSDYSTSNQTSHNHSSSSNNNNNNTNDSSGNNNDKYSAYSPVQNGGNGGSTIMGAFSSYESIERLARDCGADSIDDVNAATAMLALKHGPKVFTEPFQNGAPVITSSPSEDHTYSAGGGGSTTGSGASTPLTNGNAALNGNAVLVNSNGQQNGCGSGDNQSNCASSDAAYESSEENHNITLEELEDQQRHRDGVDALLSLSRSSVVESSNSRSPTKRSSSTSVEEEHTLSCLENGHTPASQASKITVLSNGAGYNTTQQQTPSTYHAMFAESSYNAPSYYGSNANHQQCQQLQPQQHASTTVTTVTAATTAASKKLKPLRNLRTKMKRKTWVR